VLSSHSIFTRPIRWTLAVLSWLAFGIAAYLAWHSLNNSSVAGCVVGTHNGCDVVLNSSWSKWLFEVPVSVLGLACYATLAGLSVLLGIQSAASRWITTAFILFATLAAGASLWFIGLQVFAIGSYCIFCLATDICGIAIGAITAWSVFHWWRGAPRLRSIGSPSATVSALRSAIPSSSRHAPVAVTRAAIPTETQATTPTAQRAPSTAVGRTVPLVGSTSAASSFRMFAPPPSIPIAYGGAIALLVVLVGGQIVFPAKTYKVLPPTLPANIDLSAASGNGESANPSDNAATHVTLRVDAEADSIDQKTESTAATASNGNGASTGETDPSSGDDSASASPPEPKAERKIKLLGGKLTIDVADEPIIGSVNAPHIVVEMISYDCPHCRKTNSFVKKALSRYRDQVALVVLVLPLEGKCNKMITDPAASHPGACTTARTAVALAKLKPTAFPKFHDFLMSGDKEKPPSLTKTVSKAFTMADRDQLQAMRDSEEVQKKIASYVELYTTLRHHSDKGKSFGLPIQILGDQIMTGSVEKSDDVYKAWEKHLGIKPR
jgi:uncharacterized membrane protein/protein-disulfide isomerase